MTVFDPSPILSGALLNPAAVHTRTPDAQPFRNRSSVRFRADGPSGPRSATLVRLAADQVEVEDELARSS